MTAANNLAGLINSSTGNIVIPTSNAGVSFNNSSAIGAATLNDYEVGTWTPNVGGTATYSNQVGNYVKVGSLVFAEFDITIGTIGTGSTTSLRGFPFTTSNNGTPWTGATSYYASLGTAVVYLGFYIGSLSTIANFVANNGTAVTTIGYNTFTTFANSTRICGAIVYQATF